MFFNEGNSSLIFTYKQLCLIVSISAGFREIVCFGFDNVYAGFSAFLFADVMFLYSVVYGESVCDS